VAAEQNLVILHDDRDFETAARYLPDIRARGVRDVPAAD
jgi:hypothetical protein